MRKPFKKHIAQVSIEAAHGGSGRRQLLLSKTDAISQQMDAMTKGYLPVNGVFDWHDHDTIDEFFLVIKGTGRIEFEDGTIMEYSADDLIYTPANTKHKITNTGIEENEFFFIRLKE